MGLEEIVGLALSLAGTGAGITASSEENSAMNNAANAELARQQNYAKQGQNVFEQSLSQSTPQAVKAQQDAGTQKALQSYTSLNQQQVPGMSLIQGMIQPNSKNASTEDALVGAKLGQQNNAGAALQGYNASDVAQAIKDMQANTQLGQIGSFSRASENVLPLELQQAQGSQAGLSGIGSLLNSVGGLMSLYGAVNKPPAGGQGIYGLGGGMGQSYSNNPTSVWGSMYGLN